MKFVIPAAIAFAAAMMGFAQINGHTEQEEATAVAKDVADAQRQARLAIVEARINGMKPPLPALDIYDCDEPDDLCRGDTPCPGFAGYNGSRK